MNILFVHQHYYPELVGTGRRATEMCELLVKKGHEITVLTSFPKRTYHLNKEEHTKYQEIHNGVNILRLNLIFTPKSNPILRMLSYFEFSIISLFKAISLRKEVDLCLSMTPLASGIPGALLNKFYNLPHHFDVTDILPALGVISGMLKNKLLIGILRNVELFVYRNTTTFSTVTESMGQYIQGCLKTKKEMICASDWVDVSLFNENKNKYCSELRDNYALNNKKVILFEGNVGKLQNLSIVIDIIKILDSKGIKDFVFLLIGDGIDLNNIKQLTKKENIDKIIFIGRVQREYIPSFLNISDILFSNYIDNTHLDMYVPGKMYEYISANKPIVMGARGECEKLLKENKIGIAAEPSNPAKLAEAITDILKNDGYKRINNEQLIKKYSSESVVDKLNNFLVHSYASRT
ncbi:MAG: glycosyltransferase family 4 protein [Elusimicrobia bacterium]|nr:glycosyltransferase family 4 protein [Elusimicrobiota bacterium]